MHYFIMSTSKDTINVINIEFTNYQQQCNDKIRNKQNFSAMPFSVQGERVYSWTISELGKSTFSIRDDKILAKTRVSKICTCWKKFHTSRSNVWESAKRFINATSIKIKMDERKQKSFRVAWIRNSFSIRVNLRCTVNFLCDCLFIV